MKSFKVLQLLVAALTAVVANMDPLGVGASGFPACDGESGCGFDLSDRALRSSSSLVVEVTTVATVTPLELSSNKIVTLTVETFTTLPCSETDIGPSTVTLSEHSTTTGVVTAIRTPSESTYSSSSGPISTTIAASGPIITSSAAFSSSPASISISVVTFSTITTSSTALSSTSTKFSTIPSGSSSISLTQTLSSTALGTPTPVSLQTYSGIPNKFSATSSVDALLVSSSYTQPAVTTFTTLSVVPLPVTSTPRSLGKIVTTTSSSTSTHTIFVLLNPSYGIISSMIASASTLSHPTAVAAPPSSALITDTGSCVLSTVYVTVTGLIPVSNGNASKTIITSTMTMPNQALSPSPSNALSLSHTPNSQTPQAKVSIDALSASGPHSDTSAAIAIQTAAASNITNASNSSTSAGNIAPSVSPFVTPSNISTSPADRLCSHMALLLSLMGALFLFAA